MPTSRKDRYRWQQGGTGIGTIQKQAFIVQQFSAQRPIIGTVSIIREAHFLMVCRSGGPVGRLYLLPGACIELRLIGLSSLLDGVAGQQGLGRALVLSAGHRAGRSPVA